MMKAVSMTALLLFATRVAFAADPAPPSSAAKQEAAQPAPAQTPKATASTPASKGKRTGDRLDLDTTVVTGNRELPKVLYIVPWKKADLGDLPSQPFNTLLDEALTPVDRDVFRREVTYYGAVSSSANSRAAPAASQPAGPEK